jgi:DeoR/GlpR family transcriptional regulator of sugar metabolism
MDADLPTARRAEIAARLARGQAVAATALAAEFRVSEDAIRRDLRALAAEGRCRRVYGGALPVRAATEPLTARMREGAERKLKLAQTAVSTIRAGQLVLLDSGSTNLALVDLLPEEADLTVVTNAVEIAAAVLRRQDLRLIVIGGAADPVVGGCVDAAAVQMIERMRIDRAFIGACSVSADFGIGAFHFADAVFKRAAVAATQNTIVLATAEKLEERAPHRVAELSEVALLVLEATSTTEQRTQLEAAGCRVVVADP